MKGDIYEIPQRITANHEIVDCKLGLVRNAIHVNSYPIPTEDIWRAQFARRDTVYYSRSVVKAQDAFVITCNITTSPGPPTQPPSIPQMVVPKGLLDSVGSLLDDPLYSDVEFIIARHGTNLKRAKRIYASKKILSRADYFKTSRGFNRIKVLRIDTHYSVFGGGFAEASSDTFSFTGGHDVDITMDDAASASTAIYGRGDDSDEEEEDQNDLDYSSDGDLPQSDEEVQVGDDPCAVNADAVLGPTPSGEIIPDGGAENAHTTLSSYPMHLSSPRNLSTPRVRRKPSAGRAQPGPPKMRVIVKDVAYSTYRAVLYYVGGSPTSGLVMIQTSPALHRHNSFRTFIFFFSCVSYFPRARP